VLRNRNIAPLLKEEARQLQQLTILKPFYPLDVSAFFEKQVLFFNQTSLCKV